METSEGDQIRFREINKAIIPILEETQVRKPKRRRDIAMQISTLRRRLCTARLSQLGAVPRALWPTWSKTGMQLPCMHISAVSQGCMVNTSAASFWPPAMLDRARSYSWPEARDKTRKTRQEEFEDVTIGLEDFVIPGSRAAESLYTRLDVGEIRLLEVFPGVDNEPLRANLRVRSLATAPPYHAISYCWGSPNRTKQLILNQRSIDITESLFAALRSFRPRAGVAVLWADAICINQDDEHEIMGQLNLAASIYREAEMVLVYLSEHKPEDALTSWFIGWLNIYEEQYQESLESYQFPPFALLGHFRHALIDAADNFCCPCCESTFNWNAKSLSGRFQEGLRAMQNLLDLPWFQRLWTLQENAVARVSLFCFGTHRTTWSLLWVAIKVCERYANCESPFTIKERDVFARAVRIALIVQQYNQSEKAISSARGTQCLLNMLLKAWMFKSSFVQDRLNSIKALAFIEHEADLQLDVNLHVSALWTRVACFLLTRESAWNSSNIYGPRVCQSFVLTLAGLQQGRKSPLLPSWVPDMEKLNRESEQKYRYSLINYSLNCAGGAGRSFEVDVTDTPGTLFVHGAYLAQVVDILPGTQYRPRENAWATDTVIIRYDSGRVFGLDYLQDTIPEDNEPDVHEPPPLGVEAWAEQYWIEVREWLFPWYILCYDFVHERLKDYTYGDDQVNGFSVLLAQGCVFNDLKTRQMFEQYPLRDAILKVASELLDGLPQHRGQGVRSKPSPEQFYEHMLMYLHPRILGEARCLDGARILADFSDGHVGWVPEHAQKGDVLYLLQGAPEPYILRPAVVGLISDPDIPLYTLVGDAYILGIMRGEAWPFDIDLDGDDGVIGLI
nr:heterokaryon incompatibility protein 6, or allele [Quercus suber]